MDEKEQITMDESGREVYRSYPLAGVRRMIRENLGTSLNSTAQSSSFIKPDLTRLVEYRGELKEQGVDVSYTAMIIKLLAVALQREPWMNSSIVENKAVLFKTVNMGIAMPGPDDTLMVPVIKDVDKKTVVEIAEDLKAIAKKIEERKIGADDFEGATFTFSSMGMYEIGGGTPILNLPASAICMLGNIFYEPACNENKEIYVRPTAYFSFTVDHGIIMGVPTVRFYKEFINVLQEPEKHIAV
jgi:pyruvate dehydrogenase E2 component (dihydrolipoamide acetyltransferase)